jgi:F-type H+-transporting ATPase subunit gamma
VPSLKIIRKRISSVRNTQQITKAMKMVSAAKLRRAQEAVVASRPYAEKLGELLANVAGVLPGDAHPLLRRPPENPRTVLVILTADRGLCGAFNSALLRQAEAYLRQAAGREVTLVTVGRKGGEYFKRRPVTIAERRLQSESTPLAQARALAASLSARFVAGEIDRVDILYSRFRSALSQIPTVETILPVTVERKDEEAAPVEYLVEPDPATLLARLLPQSVEARIYHAILESLASEHGARMTAMDSATSNASDMIFRLTLEMNRARQAAITKELMEIVGGAEALKG